MAVQQYHHTSLLYISKKEWEDDSSGPCCRSQILLNVRGLSGVKMTKGRNNRLFSRMSQIFTTWVTGCSEKAMAKFSPLPDTWSVLQIVQQHLSCNISHGTGLFNLASTECLSGMICLFKDCIEFDGCWCAWVNKHNMQMRYGFKGNMHSYYRALALQITLLLLQGRGVWRALLMMIDLWLVFFPNRSLQTKSCTPSCSLVSCNLLGAVFQDLCLAVSLQLT